MKDKTMKALSVFEAKMKLSLEDEKGKAPCA
jgi:hypothetical protein